LINRPKDGNAEGRVSTQACRLRSRSPSTPSRRNRPSGALEPRQRPHFRGV